MDLMKAKPSDSPRSPEMEPQPSDKIGASRDCPSWETTTPKKVSDPPQRIRYHRHSQLPEKYDMLLKFFDALEASLKLLRLRKSMPIFSKIRVMIETISERRFTHQHLAQLKYLLPEEMGVKRILLPDEETRCMKHDLRLSLNLNMMSNTKKRKRGKHSYLRESFLSRLLQFLRTSPEGAEVPEEELPEPFNQQKQDLLLHSTKHSSSLSHTQKSSDVAVELQPAPASHLSTSFKKRFSRGDLGNETGNNLRSPSKPSLQSPSIYVSKPSMNEDELECPALLSNQSAAQSKQKAFTDDETCSPQIDRRKSTTPIKSAGTPMFKVGTPALKTPKRCPMSPDDDFVSSPSKVVNRPSCAKSLRFDASSRSGKVELQVDEADCSNVLDILPADLVQSLKEKEKKVATRKQMIARLPKMFDRIYYLFQSPKGSAIRKEALIHDLTERHSDITDQSEIEEQLKLLHEIIPEFILHKLSPSGSILYSINKELNPNTLRLRLAKAV